MIIGDFDYPLAESVIFFVLILSIVFNTFLFRRGEGNYSIKYELMRNQQFFRSNIMVTYFIEGLYKFFFALPFILLITLSILAAIRDINNLAPILINGLIILLILYPFKSQFFYYRLFLVWLLATGSQLSTLFIYEKNGEQAYYVLSAIFYTGNVMVFYLALISIERDYWEIGDGIKVVSEQIKQVNERWLQQDGISKIFKGGLYGTFSKSHHHYLQYLLLYLISLLFLITYALLAHYILGSKLGYVGLVSSVIYDIFVQIFNSLDHEGRSLKTVFFVLVLSRFFSFVFGLENWLLGYCVLYFFVSVFIGWIIIDKHLPLKPETQQNKPDQTQVTFLNGLKTPQFVLIVLTIQIIIMILVQAYALPQADPTLQYNNITIPIWQWGILVLVAAWIVIIYLLSVRVLVRHQYKIFSLTQYYFGMYWITEYHVYVGLSYVLLVGLGVYMNLYLGDRVVLVCCVFLPLMYMCLMAIFVAWVKNQYHILADTEQYNALMLKKYQAKVKKNKLIQMNDKLKNKKKQLMISKYTKNFDLGFSQLRNVFDGKEDKNRENGNGNGNGDNGFGEDWGFRTGELSGGNLNPRPQGEEKEGKEGKVVVNGVEIQKFVELRDWRKAEENVGCGEIWSCLTPNDKKIIIVFIIFLLISIGYCLTSMLWCSSKFAISLLVCVLSYMSLMPYIKFYKTKQPILIGQIILNWCGFALGISYWSVYNSQIIGPIAFSICYLLLTLFLLIKCYQTELTLLTTLNPSLQILLSIAFIEITLALHDTIVKAVVFGIVFFIAVVLQVPVYYVLVYQHVPKVVVGVCATLIGAVVVVIAVLGYWYQVLGSFAIFTTVMVLIFVGFFVAAVAIYIRRINNLEQCPNVYSAYGQPNYYFESSKQTLKPNNAHIFLFSFSMITLVIFLVIVSVFFDQKQWAVYGLSLFLLMELFINMQICTYSYVLLGKERKNKMLTDEIVKESLMKLKGEYMVEEIAGEDSPYFQKLLNQAKERVQDDAANPEKWKEVVLYHDLFVKNQKEQQKFMFFWIALIMFNIMAKKRQIISQTLAQVKSIEQELISNGIILESLELNLKPAEKYQKLMKEVNKLEPLDFMIYEQILENHRTEEAKKKIQIEEQHKKQNQENDRRNQELYNQLNKKGQVSQISQIENFKKLIKSLGRKNLFCDQEFPANQNSLGDQLRTSVFSWRRPTPEEVLTKGGMTADDVLQGNIGDCYLVSSFAVLGDQRIKQALGYDAQGNQIWTNQKGAYMVRFFKFSRQIYIIIDDLLPVNENNEWVFAKSQEPSQYWPCILEKAYAKMYGGYDKIIEGKNHQVFSEFTGGFPYEILLKDYAKNPFGLWNQLMICRKNNYLLAAGSPPNTKGDSVASKRGIVQGHAFSILDAKQVDEYKLIKLKNPHGSKGREWIGQFSDRSDLMTKRMMGLLDHTKSNDGIFWMKIEDFIYEFNSMYVCAVFDQKWKKFGPIKGKWTDQNSFGTPNNEGAQKNPQYGIKVSKKCFLFVNLAQQSVSALKGKNYIYMKAMKIGGKRICKNTVDSQKSIGKMQPPTNLTSISLQIQLEAPEYPYTFSLMVSCDKPGKTGEFILTVYCDDQKAQLIDDSVFDRQ